MKIVIIGSGNIASYFAHQFHKNEHEIIQIISSTLSHAQALAGCYNCSYSDTIDDVIHDDTAVYVLAVKDDVLLELNQSLRLENKIVIHTAGSITLNDIKDISKDLGSIWCMYSINKNHLPERHDIPLIINATNEEVFQVVRELSICISNSHYELSDGEKSIAHLSAVFANNFANHLFTIGQEILNKEKIPFEILIPLIQNTIEKLDYSSPDKLQTGPALRHDVKTISKHEELLKDHSEFLKIYQLLTESIQKTY